MKLIVLFAVVLLLARAEVPPEGVVYCSTSDDNCYTLENEYKSVCDTGERPAVCKNMVPIVSTGGQADDNNEYCHDLFKISSYCEKYAQTGCQIQSVYLTSYQCAGVECWHNTSSEFCVPNTQTTTEITPCTSNDDCIAPKTCESNLIDSTAQRTCKLPALIGERCWTNMLGSNVPCDYGKCVGYTCKAFAKRGERCNMDGGYPACDPFHVCNVGFCVGKYSVDENKLCSSDSACQSGDCGSYGVCVPVSRQRCMGASDCPVGATCKKGTCFNPEVVARRQLLSCMYTSKIFTTTAPGRNLTDLMLQKCQKPLARYLCTKNCFNREEDYSLIGDITIDGMSFPIGFNRVVQVDCGSQSIKPLVGQCGLRPSNVWDDCEDVRHYSPSAMAIPAFALVASLVVANL